MDYKIPTRPNRLGVPAGGRAESTAVRPSTSKSTPVPVKTEPDVPVQEFSLRVPKNNVRPVSIMRFNKALGVDPSNWTSVRMAREDNSRLHKTVQILPDEEMPKFGAGSEYGREAREEARRRKYGLNRKKYNPDDQPWLLKLGAGDNKATTRKYKGVREGGVSENASYFIFTQAPDGAFEVFPVNHWYNFTPIQRYKSLTSEEAEQEFGRRNKIMNYFSVMVRRRMRNDDDVEEEPLPGISSGKKGGKKVSSDLKVSEMEDWAESDDEEMSDEGEDADEKPKDKKKGATAKGKKAPPKKKKKGSDDDEGLEDSDDGDEEGRELDYISDTSGSADSEPEKEGDIKGVDQEEAMRDLLESGSDSEEEGKGEKKASDEGEDEAGPSTSKNNEEQAESTDKKKKKKKKKKSERKETEYLSDDGEKSDDNVESKMDLGLDSSFVKTEPGTGSDGKGSSFGNLGDSESPNMTGKRKASSDLLNMSSSSNKKPKMEVSSILIQSAAAEGITEEAVRRYLLRKPMTVTELLHKFKSKKTKISSQDMVNVVAHILKKINPVKRNQNSKMYLSLTAPKP
ncbi:general transcription factor IIF subunit 1 [Folsomia candida]|uniref:Transcription initiation factor IIF subunit alpha n=1 Tax=Folsomia candida TaxID=158441 RepID=A0A226F5U2_FOLCA|nr:general transcription factor IIF subunit 1 [Folsomia candida]OXA65162.1 General transcription factor IIF subunit 1 [Folsomia candida]